MPMNTRQDFPNRSIVFKEQTRERAFGAETDELLSIACLSVLKERYLNSAWGYKPKTQDITPDEVEFLKFYEDEGKYLPAILRRYADRLADQLQARVNVDKSDPDWTWYHTVQDLLNLPQDEAIDYKIPFRGRIIPTSYYLLLQRQNHPHESLSLVDG